MKHSYFSNSPMAVKKKSVSGQRFAAAVRFEPLPLLMMAPKRLLRVPTGCVNVK
jgi:hypothetical protein